jgi:hypothetical protein
LGVEVSNCTVFHGSKKLDVLFDVHDSSSLERDAIWIVSAVAVADVGVERWCLERHWLYPLVARRWLNKLTELWMRLLRARVMWVAVPDISVAVDPATVWVLQAFEIHVRVLFFVDVVHG